MSEGAAAGRTKVLYIVGAARSGSTLLGNALGQIAGFFHAGEVHAVKRTLSAGGLCGCGTPLESCAVWAGVLGRVGDRLPPLFGREGFRTRHALSLATPWTRRWAERTTRAWVDILSSFYGAVAGGTASRVVVDSSKSPAYAFMLSLVRSIDLHIVHLVRDPHGVSWSWARPKRNPGLHRPMRTYGLFQGVALWLSWNLLVELLRRGPWKGRCIRLRYEDFVDDPRQAIDAVLEGFGEEGGGLDFVEEGGVRLGPSHTVMGNPVRFSRGLVPLVPDNRWVTEMPPLRRAAITLLTWPLLLRYGYGCPGRPVR
jgi:hypothetical protein